MNSHDRRKRARALKRYRDTIRPTIEAMREFLRSPCPNNIVINRDGDISYSPDTWVRKKFMGEDMMKVDVVYFLRSIGEPSIPEINSSGEPYYSINEDKIFKGGVT